jgi:hypothetical protein
MANILIDRPAESFSDDLTLAGSETYIIYNANRTKMRIIRIEGNGARRVESPEFLAAEAVGLSVPNLKTEAGYALAHGLALAKARDEA